MSKVHLEKIEWKNYRGCLTTSFTPCKDLSAIIGKNASGKSTILNGINLLKKIANPRHARSAVESAENDNIRKGSLKAVFVVNETKVTLSVSFSYYTDEQNEDVICESECKWSIPLPESTRNEQLEMPLGLITNNPEAYMLTKSGFRRKTMFEMKKGDVLDEVFFGKIERFMPTLQIIGNYIDGITYYSASQFSDPSRAPISLEIDERGRIGGTVSYRITSHGRFLRDLWGAKNSDADYFHQFHSVVGKDGMRIIDNIEFLEIEIPASVYQVSSGGTVAVKEVRKKIIVPRFNVNGIFLSPNQLSEGTFKSLALIYYILANKGDVLLIEEPEIGVHSGLLNGIISIITSMSAEKQIIVSTHSDGLISKLKPSNVFVAKNQEDSGIVVSPIPKYLSKSDYKAMKAYLEEQGTLGEYMKEAY